MFWRHFSRLCPPLTGFSLLAHDCIHPACSDSVKANATVDVSVAVATDGGLITPIVKGADGLGLTGIADKVKDLAGRARAGA